MGEVVDEYIGPGRSLTRTGSHRGQCSLLTMLMGDMAGGAIQRHGGQLSGWRLREIEYYSTRDCIHENQKLSTANRWNLSRSHGWDVQKQNKKLIWGLHQIVSSWPVRTRFQPLYLRRRPGGNSEFCSSSWFWWQCWSKFYLVRKHCLPCPRRPRLTP